MRPPMNLMISMCAPGSIHPEDSVEKLKLLIYDSIGVDVEWLILLQREKSMFKQKKYDYY